MKTEFRRESEHHYLIIDSDSLTEKDFAVRMLEENRIDHLAPLICRTMNSRLQLYYEISGLDAVTSVFDQMPMSGSMIRRLFEDMENALREAERFFLDPEDILLDPDYIFVDPVSGEASFCYLPGKPVQEKPDSFILSEYILKRLDHADRDAVSIGYGFYREMSRPDAVLINALREVADPAIPVTRSSLRSLEYQDEQQRLDDVSSMLSSPAGEEHKTAHAVKSGQSKLKDNGRKPGKTGRVALILIPFSAAAAGLLSFLSGADLTASGGLFALAGALDWLIINTVRNTENGRNNLWSDTPMNSAEEEDLIRSLLKENSLQGNNSEV